jgi:hypothetical protein
LAILFAGFAMKAQAEDESTGAAPKANLEMKGNISSINALLISELEGGELAGFAQKFTATAIQTGGSEAMVVKFNQKVGKSMLAALKTVVRGLQVHYKAWPHGASVEFSFEEKYGAKDGPSASVACALLIDSLITGIKLNPKFAVTGDMNPDLSVQPIGGVEAKIRGAAKDKCDVIAIPIGCKREIIDMAVLKQYADIRAVQIFTIKNFEQAKALAAAEKSSDVEASIVAFAKLDGSNKKAAEAELRAILKRTPNHLSAEIMLKALLGSIPRKLSLSGSFAKLENSAEPFMKALREKKFSSVSDKQFTDANIELRTLSPILDKRAHPYYRSVTDFVVIIRRYSTQSFGNRTQLDAAVEEINKVSDRVLEELEHLRSNKEIQEALQD